MADLLIDDLDPGLVEWLAARAGERGHTLEDEVREILARASRDPDWPRRSNSKDTGRVAEQPE